MRRRGARTEVGWVAVYVDPVSNYGLEQVPPAARQHGTRWCRLMADTREELDAAAAMLQLRPEWLQAPGTPLEHYALTPARRGKAVKLGVKELGVAAFERWLAARAKAAQPAGKEAA